MPGPSIANTPGFNEARALGTLERLASTTSGILVNQYAYNDVKRVVSINEEDETVEAEDGDPLGSILVDGLTNLAFTERVGNHEVDVEPLASVAALFQASPEARALKPRQQRPRQP